MNFTDNILKNTSGLQNYEKNFEEKVKQYVDIIVEFCTNDKYSDTDNFLLPIKDREYINKAVQIAANELKCACTTLNPTIFEDIEEEIKKLENLAKNNDFVIVNLDFSPAYSSDLKEKITKLYMKIYGLEIKNKLKILLYCDDETIDSLDNDGYEYQ